MASAARSNMVSDRWFLTTTLTLVCAILGYLVYDAIMSTAAELLQRLLMISPLLLIMAVHWLSSSTGLDISVPGLEPAAIHRAGGSPWGIALVLLLLLFLISYQPSLHGLLF